LVQGNFIGTDVAGAALGNATIGVDLENANGNIIGGTPSGAGNVIANNGGSGVIVVLASTGDAIQRNSIYNNVKLGIDLGNDDVTPNDFQDVDQGPNNLQNFPNLSLGWSSSGFTVIRGSINSTPSTKLVIEFFNSPTADPTGHGEGQTYIGYRTVITNANGDANITFRMSSGIPVGSVVSATATDPAGNTSEFGPTIVIGQGPGTAPGGSGGGDRQPVVPTGQSGTGTQTPVRMVRLLEPTSSSPKLVSPSGTGPYHVVSSVAPPAEDWLSPAEIELLAHDSLR
jgi:hypothetical protein